MNYWKAVNFSQNIKNEMCVCNTVSYVSALVDSAFAIYKSRGYRTWLVQEEWYGYV